MAKITPRRNIFNYTYMENFKDNHEVEFINNCWYFYDHKFVYLFLFLMTPLQACVFALIASRLKKFLVPGCN